MGNLSECLTACLLHMSRLVNLSGRLSESVPQRKASPDGRRVAGLDAKRGDLSSARVKRGNTAWRPEPVLVENSSMS